MKSTLAAIVLVATSITAMAQGTPVGLWRNVDDKSGEVKAEIRIGEADDCQHSRANQHHHGRDDRYHAGLLVDHPGDHRGAENRKQ